MSVSAARLDEWRGAIGREQTRRQRLDPDSLRRFAVAMGSEADAPMLGHWAWFLEARPDDGIGVDGHPTRGDFLPAVTLPRRMFAAAAIDFHAPLEIGAEAELTSRIADVRHRGGASGDLVFVDVDRRLTQASHPRLTELQTIVYRQSGGAIALPEIREAVDGETWRPSRVNLFRFSAATFNSHRIHYDLPYAREVEGYPDLVVQGPLTAARLAELAARDGAIAGIEFRLLAPLFVDQPVALVRAKPDEFHAVRCDGVTATILKATYR